MQGGIVQPIQQQSWSLVINGDSTPNVMTGLNPHYNSAELTMFFPEYPEFMMERIGAVKQGYPNENKWVGGSPYEHIYQDKNLLIASYDLPDSATYHHVDLFIPNILLQYDTFLREPVDGYTAWPSPDQLNRSQAPQWIVRTSASGTRVGIRPAAPFQIIEEANGVRLRMRSGRSGYAVYCEYAPGGSIESFRKKLSKLDVKPRSYSDPIAKKQGPDKWLYYSPYLKSKFESGVITITHGKDTLVLDFTR
jgi:hypothetical protein